MSLYLTDPHAMPVRIKAYPKRNWFPGPADDLTLTPVGRTSHATPNASEDVCYADFFRIPSAVAS